MSKFNAFLAKLIGRKMRHEADLIDYQVRKPDKSGYPRQLRSFDTLVIAPYDDKSLVAYLQAGSLDELKTGEAKVFMLSLEQPDGLGLTEGWIAEHFAMQPSEVAANLTSLERKGYMLHVPCKFVDDTEAPGYGWVFDPDQFWCDTDLRSCHLWMAPAARGKLS